MPSARLFLLLGGVSLLFVGGLAVEPLAWTALGVDGLLLAAFALDLLRARRQPLEAEREWPPLLAQGAAAAITVRIDAPAGRALRLRLREALHPALSAGPLRHELLLAPSDQARRARWQYSLLPRHRGEPEAGPLTARLLGPWGLAWSQRPLLPPEPRRVYPQVRWEGRVGHLLALAHRHQLGSEPMHRIGVGSEPYALRDYRAGDPPSRIHWKATARHDRMITREETWERGARLVILLDTGRAMTSSDAGRSKLDHALAAALALARVASGRGDRVTLVAFSHHVERSVRMTAGSRGLAAAYGALFDLEARLTEPAYDLAAETALALEPRHATVVLFTSVADLAAGELLRDSLLQLERRHRPLLVNLRDPDLETLARRPPTSPEEAFAQVSALEILLANRRLARHLRRAGIRIVETPADRLALDALESYLALFRQRRGSGARLSGTTRGV
ncbi:MAG: DUF58 domain-containing protein [Acidobacteria bacterium]|nr:DUF58 domain-containing protein [Acidobacteriota bacterium]